jgi:DNA-binding transcriptional ArsR family regulator
MDAADTYLLLADRNRRRILELVLAGSPTVTDIVRATRLHQPLVSHHLALLKAAGVVVSAREGRFRRYSPASAEVVKALADLSKAAGVVAQAGAKAVEASPPDKRAALQGRRSGK